MAKIQYASNGKRDLHGLEDKHDNALRKLKKERWTYDNNRKITIEYLRACKLGQAKSGGKNKKIGKSTMYRIAGILRLLSENWLKEDFDKANENSKCWEKLYEAMEDDKIKNEYDKKFKQSTKSKNYKTIKKFLKWKYGENKYYPPYCDDWVVTEERTTREFLTRGEVEKLINGASALKIKCMVMMLFDGGFRIEELSNLRWCDLKKPEGKEYYRAFIRLETSKTNRERHVSLPLATDFIDMYKNWNKQKLKKKFSESDFIFKTGYHNIHDTISKLGRRILNKSIYPHILRHSSATYYSGIIKTYQMFCARYGWNLKSDTAQRYFHKVTDDEIAEQSKDHEIQRFKTEFERMKLISGRKDREIEILKKQMAEIVSRIADIETIKGAIAIKETRN